MTYFAWPFSFQITDNNGNPAPNAKVYSYIAGSSSPSGYQNTYSTATGPANTNPIVADGYGRLSVFIPPSTSYHFIIKSNDGSQTYLDEDNVMLPGDGTGITPGGSNGSVQYNSSGSFAGSSGFLFNGTNTITIGSTSSGNITTPSTVPLYLYVNGSDTTYNQIEIGDQLTGIIFTTGGAGEAQSIFQIKEIGAWSLNGNAGSVGQILTSNGPSAPPSWQDDAEYISSIGIQSTTPALTVTGSPLTSSGTIGLSVSNFSTSNGGLAPTSPGGTTAFLRADGAWSVPPGTSSGTVSSVGLSDSSTTPIYSISNSPITSTGNLTLTLNTQTANTVFAGPTSGSPSQPTFRSLVATDLPLFTSVARGAVPGSGGGTANFLRADGAWAAGVQGATGPQGIQGTTGANGTSVHILGSVSTATALPGYPSSYTGAIGDGYVTADTGHLWVWSGSTWVDAGNVTGPQGATGPQGTQGTQGTMGFVGSQGTTGTAGTSGSQGSQGISGALSGVNSVTGSTGVTVSPTTGSVVVSIGQAVATSSNVQFNAIGVGTSNSTSGTIYATGNITAFSDKRLKNNIQPITEALSKVLSLNGVTYISTQTNQPGIGLIAQDVLKVAPEAVSENNGYYGVAYGNLVGLLVEAIKELTERVKELENK